jgi:hypothetical protein
MELYGLPFLHNIADRNGSGLLIRSDEIPNEKVASLEMTRVLIDHDTQMHRTVRIPALRFSKRFKDVLETRQGRDTAEFINKVLLRPSHNKPLTNRTTPL